MKVLMQKKSSKTRFWLILAVLNILAFLYPIGLLAMSEDDAARLFAVVLMMGGSIFLFVADAVSSVFAYWA